MNPQRIADELFFHVIALINFELTDHEMALLYRRCLDQAKTYFAAEFN